MKTTEIKKHLSELGEMELQEVAQKFMAIKIVAKIYKFTKRFFLGIGYLRIKDIPFPFGITYALLLGLFIGSLIVLAGSEKGTTGEYIPFFIEFAKTPLGILSAISMVYSIIYGIVSEEKSRKEERENEAQ